jgi:hypothetical protein
MLTLRIPSAAITTAATISNTAIPRQSFELVARAEHISGTGSALQVFGEAMRQRVSR